MSWKDAINQGREIVLATSSDDKPHAIMVISLGMVDGKLLIGACQMKTSLKNILKNRKVCIVAKYKKEYYRIKGTAEVYSSGKYFNIAVKRSKPPLPRRAVVIDIKEAFDLDRAKRIKALRQK